MPSAKPAPDVKRPSRMPAVTLLIRHAESAWNEHFSATRIDVGWPDPPLTERGVAQAHAAPAACAPNVCAG